jgi:hypothetical protein
MSFDFYLLSNHVDQSAVDFTAFFLNFLTNDSNDVYQNAVDFTDFFKLSNQLHQWSVPECSTFCSISAMFVNNQYLNLRTPNEKKEACELTRKCCAFFKYCKIKLDPNAIKKTIGNDHTRDTSFCQIFGELKNIYTK